MSTRCALLSLFALACSEPAASPSPPPAAEPAPEAPVGEDLPRDEPSTSPSLTAPTAGPDAHTWAELRFVDVDDAFGAGSRLEARVWAEEGADAMQLRLTAFGVDRDVFARARIALHLPDGAVVEPGEDAFGGLGLRGGSERPGAQRVWNAGARLPWQDNDLDEGWIEVDLQEVGRYWLEIPYGFVRDPRAPLPTPDARREARPARAMADLGARDHWVPFRHARYELGEIQNGWRLEVLASNPFDPHVELVLYRDDGRVGQSVYRWALDEPTTEVEIDGHVGGRSSSLRIASRLHEDGMRRSDHFHVFRRRGGHRGWGTIVATVADERYELRVPSSLYLYTHGTADPYHARRTVGAANVLGAGLF